ncbi:hypothetical protein L202_01494 [Cryptococcus amylolentus CBS 6039]|uniref:Ubiquitin-like domain-containing protein n=2 Tax=Cryptococcus amylolentus TaxID=104669 RepID=A0A1E3I3U9_9TREE|nr:hypothetical protein L202_01494 [Cryptococcus amylolentus CBS 6039]ODN83333.1 hypothetical protein L202_01494 [Cryptococcus amylolentus CBS 6039]ODO10881.1 hypothetical protein I350_01480 [Cryptococcus amylolentus CBS 6273]
MRGKSCRYNTLLPYYPAIPPSASPAKLLSPLISLLFLPQVLAKAATVSFFNPFRRAQAEAAQGAITVQVKWGRDRFNIPIPQPSITPLATLLATLSNQTGLPVNQLKLVHKGAVLKDTSLTVSAYGITEGANLVLIGKGGDIPAPASSAPKQAAPVAKKPKQPETDSEPVLVDWIKSLVANLLDPLKPSIATFISYTSPHVTNRPAKIPAFEVLQKEHARLSELLLKALLELDGVNIQGGWDVARKERKEGVRGIQGELNRVDEAWGERKRIGA